MCFGSAISAAVHDILGGAPKVDDICCSAVLGYTDARLETKVAGLPKKSTLPTYTFEIRGSLGNPLGILKGTLREPLHFG